MEIKAPGGRLVECPHCGSRDLRYSQSENVVDLVMHFWRKHALRCRECGARFYGRTDEAKNWIWTTKG
jgi:DNA-directed RNA polymerase subunit RPC12/RpoP